MRTFDTNVVARIVLGDDPQQAALAARQWLAGLRTGGIFLPVVVLMEVVWVLARTAKLSRERILSELQRLTDMEGVGWKMCRSSDEQSNCMRILQQILQTAWCLNRPAPPMRCPCIPSTGALPATQRFHSLLRRRPHDHLPALTGR